MDSSYVVRGINEWRASWEKQGLRRRVNADLWQRLFALCDGHPNVKFEWVRGHSGDELNEAADALARGAAELLSGSAA